MIPFRFASRLLLVLWGPVAWGDARDLQEAVRAWGLEQGEALTLPAHAGHFTDPGPRILPRVVEHELNPFQPVLQARCKNLHGEAQHHEKEEALRASFADSPAIRAHVAPLIIKTWAFCSPQSPAHEDPKLLQQILRDFDAAFALHHQGDYDYGRQRIDRNMGRFLGAHLNDALLMLTRSYPGLVPDGVLKRWKQSVRACTDYQVNTFGQKLRPYPNIDASYALQLQAAGMLLDEPEYIRRAKERVFALRGLVYAAGGMPYIDYTNDSPNYHGVVLVQLGRYLQLSGDPMAGQVIRRMNEWYPRVCEPNGCINQVAAPHWKSYWDFKLPLCDIELAGNLVPNAGNKEIAYSRHAVMKQTGDTNYYRDKIAVSLLVAGSTWRNDQPRFDPGPPYFTLFDENTRGPRGRFGNWSWLCNGREQAARPKLSLAGCMVLDGEAPNAPGAAALQIASLHPAGTSPLMHRDACVSTVDTKVCAFSSRYEFEGALGVQLWLMTPKRMIGLITGEAAEAIDWTAWLRVGDCRAGIFEPAQPRFQSVDHGQWQHGALRLDALFVDKQQAFTEEAAKDWRPGPNAKDLRLNLPARKQALFGISGRRADVAWVRSAEQQVDWKRRLFRLSFTDESGEFLLIFNASDQEQALGAFRVDGGPEKLGAGKQLMISGP